MVSSLNVRLFYASYFFHGFYNNLFTVQEVRKAPEGATPPDLALWKSLSMMPWDIVVLVIQFVVLVKSDPCDGIDVKHFWEFQGSL